MANIDEGEDEAAATLKKQPQKGAKAKKTLKNVFDFAADDSNNNDSSIDSDGGGIGSSRPVSSPKMEKRCWKCQEMVAIGRQWQHAFANHSDAPAFACRYCDYRNNEDRAAVEEHCHRMHANAVQLIIDNFATNQALIKQCFPPEDDEEELEEEVTVVEVDKEGEEEKEEEMAKKEEDNVGDKGEEDGKKEGEQTMTPEKPIPSTSGRRRRVAKKSFPSSKNSTPQKAKTSSSGNNVGSSNSATPFATTTTTPLPKRVTCPVDGCGVSYVLSGSIARVVDHFLDKHTPAAMGIQKSFFQCSASSCSFQNRQRGKVVAHIRKVHPHVSVRVLDTRHRFTAAVLAAIGQAHPELVDRCAEYLKRTEGNEEEEEGEKTTTDDAVIGAIIQLNNEEEDGNQKQHHSTANSEAGKKEKASPLVVKLAEEEAEEASDDDKEKKPPKATRAQLRQQGSMASDGDGAISSPLVVVGASSAKCAICQKVINRRNWARHAFSQHSPLVPAYACPHCTFKDNNSINAVKKHMQQAHGDHQQQTIINNVEVQPGVVARCFGGGKNATDTTTSTNTATPLQAAGNKKKRSSAAPFEAAVTSPPAADSPTASTERHRRVTRSSSRSDDRRPSITSSTSNSSSSGASQQCQRCLVVVQATPTAQIAHYFLRHAKVKRYKCPYCPDFEHDEARPVQKHVEAKHKDLNQPDQWTDRATLADHKMAIRQLFPTPTTPKPKPKPTPEKKKRRQVSNDSARTNSSSNSPDFPQASPTTTNHLPNPMASMWSPMMMFPGGGRGGGGGGGMPPMFMPFMQGMQAMGGGGPGMQQQIQASGSGSGMMPMVPMMVPMPLAASFMQQMMMAAQMGMGAPGGASGTGNNNSGSGGGEGQGGGREGPPSKRRRQQ